MDTCLSIRNNNNILFLAIGGGGDIVLAATLATSYERCGGKAVIGSIVWERYIIDPIPGPISVDEFSNVVEKYNGYAIVNHNSFALRGERVVIPQAVNVAKALDRSIAIFDINHGSVGLAKAIEDFMNRYNVDVVIGVDVGGDSIAEGFEEELWSPLADAISVAALAHINKSYIAIASPGSDGELSLDYIEKRIRRIIRLGGYVGGYVLSKKDLEILKHILEKAISEASSIPLIVINTDAESISIRKQSRSIRLSLMGLTIFLLDAIVVARDSLARYIYETYNLREARRILNMLGIATEYDIEEEIFKELQTKKSYAELDLLEIRNRVRKKLVEHHISLRDIVAKNHSLETS